MKRRKRLFISILTGVITVFSLNLWSVPVYPGKTMGVGIEAGYVLFKDSQFNDTPSGNVTFFYAPFNGMRFEFKGGFIPCRVDDRAGGAGRGKLSIIPLQLSAQYYFALKKEVVSYVGGGIDLYLLHFSLDQTVSWLSEGFVVKEKIKSRFGYHVGAGVEVMANAGTVIFIDARYAIVTPHGQYAMVDTTTGIETSGTYSVHLSPVTIGMGVRFLF
ncbi:MAG: OmpW family outer membrane protein [Candidatus Omnitrophota bacterium]